VSAVDVSIIDDVVERATALDYLGLTELYAPDVLVDMNLPMWRFQLQGPDAVRAWFQEQHPAMPNLRCTSHRVHPIDRGVIVENEGRFDGQDGECLFRAVDIFHVDGGRIVEHVEYCGGCWTPDDIARQRAEAPMIRW
jgi:ketosteroid isomerase-like protein